MCLEVAPNFRDSFIKGKLYVPIIENINTEIDASHQAFYYSTRITLANNTAAVFYNSMEPRKNLRDNIYLLESKYKIVLEEFVNLTPIEIIESPMMYLGKFRFHLYTCAHDEEDPDCDFHICRGPVDFYKFLWHKNIAYIEARDLVFTEQSFKEVIL